MALTLEQFREWQTTYRSNLPGFVRALWVVEPDHWQEEVGTWLSRDEHRRIAVPSGHGVGKTALAAWAAIWFLLTRYPVKVILTAPSSATLEDGLFAEIKHWIGRLPPVVQQLLEVTADRVVLKADPANAFISARTARADRPDALQGIHADYVLLIIDEASGVPEPVFESSQGSMSGVARFMLLLGNPVYAQGYFYRAITEGRDNPWKVRNVSCLEAKRSPQEYIDEIAHDYGEDSNTYRVRVLGLPPKGDDDTVIRLDLVQASYTRDVDVIPNAPRIWGLDVGGLNSGESALCERRGNWVPEKPERFRGIDEMQLVGRVAAAYEALSDVPDKYGITQRPARVCVDANGMGAGVASRLRELGLPVAAINVSEVRSTTGKWANLKAELWWRARAWFEERMCRFPSDDPELVRALTIPKIRYHSTGRLMVESKDDMKRRLKSRMPRMDAADAFILTFAANDVVAQQGARKFRRGPLRRHLSGIV